MSARPPLELAVEVTSANGTVTRWDGNARSAGDVPKGITFNTKRGDGFSDGPTISLSRRIDQDFCVDESTEVLTADGWKSYDQVDVGDQALTLNPETREITWQDVLAVNVFPGPHEMIRWTNTGFDALTTLNHRWLADTCGLRGGHWSLKPDRPNWHFTTTGEIENFYRKRLIVSGGHYAGPAAMHADELVELAGWYVTEGWPEKTGGVNVSQSISHNPEYVEDIRGLAGRCRAQGSFVSERKPRDMGWGPIAHFYFGRGAGQSVKNVLCPNKALTAEFLCSLSGEQARSLMTILLAADGSVHKHNGTRVFTQQDRGRCDAFQMLCAMLGVRTKMRPGDGANEITAYKATIADTHEMRRERVRHAGIAWCPTTPNGTWMARRNGVTYWTGNSDINLYDDVRLIGADGSIAYEGYIAANPRTFDGGHTVSIRVAGPMTLAQRRPFSEVFIDRDLTQWQGPSNARQAALIALNFSPSGPAQQADPGGNNTLATQFNEGGGWTLVGIPEIEALYLPPSGVTLGSLYYEWEKGVNVTAADANWEWAALLADDDTLVSADATANLRATGPGSGTLASTTTGRKVAALQFLYNAADGSATQRIFAVYWRNLAALGSHGLALHPSTTPGPGGLYVSDMIANLCSRFVPKLDPSGVQQTTYPVDHAVFSQTQPYDAWLALNKYHLWELGVWEKRKLCYYPADLSHYDWQVRLDDPGVTVDLPGESTEQLANGIVVSYLDITTGRVEVLSPDDTPALSDPNPLNPATLHGETAWTPLDLSSLPLTTSDATQIGIAALAEANQVKAAGTIKIQGHIRDRAGHWQPFWKVRASDTIAIVNHPDDRPRLIGETSCDQDALTNTIAVDNTLSRVDAFLDRATTAIQAANLGTPSY